MIEEAERDAARLARMIQSGEELDWLARREGREKFFADRLVNHALRDCFKDFTEEAERLVKPLHRKDPRTDWDQLVDLRQRAHHVYYHLTNEQLWRFITTELPRYLRRLRRIRFEKNPTKRPGTRSDSRS